ncbi:hypothetical protein SD71_18915 [Cohnella kolymensis]|uniref:RES domain-containing protein n=1 Tax=Cohnella kolymensis TaxID=1590652 RepID=A0ABR5A1N4_9BACL|nr:RES family NAD+ phosphorylase [Cohnella kolymensis]KIL34548.1 hypothetical protein SD71_18915 [Cohnella kolymensis]
MKCCINCFNDTEIKLRITGLNRLGNCNICESVNVFIYDTEIDFDLVDDFVALLDTYRPESVLPTGFPSDQLNFLRNELLENWDIFNLSSDKIDILIKSICRTKYTEEPELFEQKVGIIEKCDKEYLLNYSILGEFSWEDFAKAIKTENRFHSKHLNITLLFDYLDYLKKAYKKDTIFYRARISDKNGFPNEKMGAPPKGVASAGRVNPEGVSYLYLGNDRTTTLNEVRAGLHDFVTIATFKLSEDINVVDLTRIDKISAFSGLDFTQHAINKPNLVKMNNDISKPLRRQDSHLDYLPTQYISEYIKTIKFKDGTVCCGIEYKSTMNKGGYNLAIFDSSLFECIDVEVYDVQELSYVVDPRIED